MATSVLPTGQLGRDGPQVTKLGFGAMGLSAVLYGDQEPDEQRFKVLDKLYELGGRFIDSSDAYGDNEELLGKWFKRSGKRDEMFIATKFAVKMLPEGRREFNNDPDFIRSAIDDSLRKLQTDHVDLWYCHRLTGKIPVETVVSVMAEAVRAGKVRHLGISEVSEDSLRRAHQIHPITAVQSEYSPFTLNIESPQTPLLKTCRELGIATVAYSPLGRGMLTGRFKSNDDFEENDWRKTAPRFNKENFPKNLKLVDTFKKFADKKGCTPGQLDLAWLMAQGDDVFPIPGTKSVKYLEENLGALKVHLTKEEVQEIREVVDQAETAGDRYPGAMNNMVFMETPKLSEV